MFHEHKFHNARFLGLTLLVIVLDQLSKAWIVSKLSFYDSIPLVSHLNLVHLRNTGAAFSMLNTASPWLFVGLAAVVSAGICSWLWKHAERERVTAAGLCLIMGGAIGNVIDRLRLGHVTDFIDFYIGDWHFAAFNVADAAITLGAGLLLLEILLDGRRRQRELF